MRSAWRGASTKWNNQVHKTTWSSCKNRAPLVSHATRSSFDREQSILRTRKPRCPSRSDRASRRTLLGRPAARYSPPRPHPCSSSTPLPFLPLSSPFFAPAARSSSRTFSLERLTTRARLASTLSSPLHARSFPFHTERRYTRTLHALQPLHRVPLENLTTRALARTQPTSGKHSRLVTSGALESLRWMNSLVL